MKELGIYVHIPFCKSKCFYCNFNSYAGCDYLQADYLKALLKEMDSFATKLKDYLITTIYIGGGTPSNFLSGGIETIIHKIHEIFNVSNECEITIEANPNTISMSKVLEWKTAGVNRVSVGLQTDNKQLLKLINRTHTKKDFLLGIEILKNNGFSNINADIMIGLPTQKLSDVKRTLKTLKKCDIPHVSAYSLIVEDGTYLKELIDQGKIKEPKEVKVLSMYDFVKNELSSWGLKRYEVSNFAKPGFECKHNLNCWNMVEYVGFGSGAHSFLNNMRFYNYSGIKEYVDNINNINNACEVSEIQSSIDLFEEYVMLKLRTAQGINLKYIKENYKLDLLMTKSNVINEFLKMNLIKVNNNYLSLTDDGFKVLNKIILELVC